MLSEFYGAEILQDVGYRGRRSRKRRREERKTIDLFSSNDDTKQKETEWQQMKQFLDPNPHLKETSQQQEYPKVCITCTLVLG